jgi:hypothetical protein
MRAASAQGDASSKQRFERSAIDQSSLGVSDGAQRLTAYQSPYTCAESAPYTTAAAAQSAWPDH